MRGIFWELFLIIGDKLAVSLRHVICDSEVKDEGFKALKVRTFIPRFRIRVEKLVTGFRQVEGQVDAFPSRQLVKLRRRGDCGCRRLRDWRFRNGEFCWSGGRKHRARDPGFDVIRHLWRHQTQKAHLRDQVILVTMPGLEQYFHHRIVNGSIAL